MQSINTQTEDAERWTSTHYAVGWTLMADTVTVTDFIQRVGLSDVK